MAWFALAIFSLVTIFAYVDRVIFSLLAEQVRVGLGLSDVQLGLLQGTGIALFAVLAYYPIGWLADRLDRRLVMSAGISVWSLAVVGCGFSRNFETLFFCSALVGAGEAVLAPVFYSMIPELFRGQKRQIANSIFGVTAASVGGLALWISGMLPGIAESLRPSLPAGLAGLETWRLSFLLAAMPAPVMIALVSLAPLGGPRASSQGEAVQVAPGGSILGFLWRHVGTMSVFFLGIGASVFGLAAIGSWGAVILMRFFGQTPALVGASLGTAALVGTLVGFLLSLLVTRLWGASLGAILPLRVLWLSYVAAAMCNLSMLATSSAATVYIIAGISLALQTTANLLIPTSIQNLAPASIRGRFIAVFFMLQYACSAAAGPIVGYVSDQLVNTPRALLVAAASVSALSLVIGSTLLWLSEWGFAKTVAASQSEDAEEAASRK